MTVNLQCSKRRDFKSSKCCVVYKLFYKTSRENVGVMKRCMGNFRLSVIGCKIVKNLKDYLLHSICEILGISESILLI